MSIDTVSGDWLGLAEVVVLMDDGEKSPDGAANARLIAAAPELLSALRMMTPEDHAKGASVCAVYARTGPCDCGVTQARAAIAKATGGES